MYNSKLILAICIALILSAQLWGQKTPEEKFSASVYADVAFPVLGDEDYFGLGFGGNAAVEYAVFPFFVPFLHGGLHVIPVHGLESMSLLDAGLGAGLRLEPAERIRLQASLLGGVYLSRWREFGTSGLFFGVRAEAGYRLSPAFTLSLHGGFNDYVSSPDPFLRSLSVGASLQIHFSELGNKSADIDIKSSNINSIFPVFYSFYDENSFGTLEITNNEETKIRKLNVSFFLPEYMSQPRLCGYAEELKPGETMEVQLFTLLNDEVLELTENIKAQAIINVEYRLMGTTRKKDISMHFPMYHRNAMTWDDDRKAAAFVSPTNPAVLWFSRFASGIAENRRRGTINRNLQQAMAIFEALRVYGIHYVIDPNSSYLELSKYSETVDYLQFPHQTLFYRGGDCDDISILYSALLESVGINTAFITIPGHIYMAFSLNMSEEEARSNFYDPSLLIFRDKQAWIPVEITLVKEGFIKAWRIGAKQWTDNVKTDNADFFPMQQNWKLYRPVGIPNVNPRFSLPDEVETIRRFDLSMNRYIAREIEPAQKELAARKDLSEEELSNKLGILYGRYGLLEEGWTQFSKAAKSDYPQAWINLANIAFLQKNYEMAVSYYDWARKLNPLDPLAFLGLARSYYELEDLQASDEAYNLLEDMDYNLASEFGYLASIIGGEGRAWTFSERLTSTIWAEQEEKESGPSHIIAKQETEPPEVQKPTAKEKEEEVRKELPEEASETNPEEFPTEDLDETEDSFPENDPEKDSEKYTEKEEETLDVPPEIDETIPEDEELKEKNEEKEEDQEKTLSEEKPAKEPASAEESVYQEQPPEIGESVPDDLELKEKEADRIEITDQEQEKEQEGLTSKKEVELTEKPEEQTAEETIPEEIEKEQKVEKEKREEGPLKPEEDSSKEDSQSETTTLPADRKNTPTKYLAILEPITEEDVFEEGLFEEGPIWRLLLDSFRNAQPALGEWTLSEKAASQDDKTQLFAKLAIPVEQKDSIIKYSFYGKSTGKNWTGLGIHILRDKIVSHTGYGAGNSILIWITYDPVHNKDKNTRLQVYRSYSDIKMELLDTVIIPVTLSNRNLYEIVYSRIDNTLTISINGEKHLELTGFPELDEGKYIVLRSLDTSEFDTLKMEMLEWRKQE